MVDRDTAVLVDYGRKQARIFRRPIEEIQVPLLITASRADEMLVNDLDAECQRLRERNPLIQYRLYDTGAHPLLLSRAEELAEQIRAFLLA